MTQPPSKSTHGRQPASGVMSAPKKTHVPSGQYISGGSKLWLPGVPGKGPHGAVFANEEKQCGLIKKTIGSSSS